MGFWLSCQHGAPRARAQAARFPAIKPFREATENRHQWCIAGVPGVGWARKVFPGKSDADAVEEHYQDHYQWWKDQPEC